MITGFSPLERFQFYAIVHPIKGFLPFERQCRICVVGHKCHGESTTPQSIWVGINHFESFLKCRFFPLKWFGFILHPWAFQTIKVLIKHLPRRHKKIQFNNPDSSKSGGKKIGTVCWEGVDSDTKACNPVDWTKQLFRVCPWVWVRASQEWKKASCRIRTAWMKPKKGGILNRTVVMRINNWDAVKSEVLNYWTYFIFWIGISRVTKMTWILYPKFFAFMVQDIIGCVLVEFNKAEPSPLEICLFNYGSEKENKEYLQRMRRGVRQWD